MREAGPASGNRRLIERLRALHPASSGRTLKQWLARGRVRVNGQIVLRGDAPVEPGDTIEVGAPGPPAPPSRLRIVHEDEDLIVVDKPAGLLTIATDRERGRTAYRFLTDYVVRAAWPRGARVFIVHRLDRETSGLLVFARSFAVKRRLQAQFEARAVERVYVAVVEGRLRSPSGVLAGRLTEDRALRVRPTRDPGQGREAITRYRVLGYGRDTTRVELSLTTGRRAQLRVQLAAIGHPIVGDATCGSRRDPLGRLGLHAARLGFRHPRGGAVVFESPPPPAFARV